MGFVAENMHGTRCIIWIALGETNPAEAEISTLSGIQQHCQPNTIWPWCSVSTLTNKCLLPGVTGQPQSHPRTVWQTDSTDRWTTWLGHTFVSVWTKLMGLQWLCSPSVSSYIWLMEWLSSWCCFFCPLVLALSVLFSAGGLGSPLCNWRQCHNLEWRREKRQIQVLPSCRWMSARHEFVSVLFPSPPTPLPLTVVLSVCLLLFFVEHRKYNSEPKLSFEQSSSLHYAWVWKQEEFVLNPT